LISRVLIVGLRSIGKLHLRLARKKFPLSSIKVLRHQKTSSIPDFSDAYFSTLEDAIQLAPQITIVANPSTFHVHVAQ
jgi:ornithine cyclodeaminase/alanine dehydrogenase-like protein (mu-crystallin family)